MSSGEKVSRDWHALKRYALANLIAATAFLSATALVMWLQIGPLVLFLGLCFLSLVIAALGFLLTLPSWRQALLGALLWLAIWFITYQIAVILMFWLFPP